MSVKKKFLIIVVCFAVSFASCEKSSPDTGGNTTPPKDSSFFAKGADISWVSQMESDNVKFYNSLGVQEDCFQIMKDLGLNAIRLRAWVNPADGWCSTKDMVEKAIRAKNLGFKIMIDLHYSDIWADPGHQTKPAAWDSLDFHGLQSALSNYTLHIMDTLQSNGISPQWVQIGNETNDGMLWEDGRASTNMAQFASLIQAGYSAVKSVSDSTKVIVHISNGYDNTLFRWVFDGLKANGANWDVIGMSLYPTTANWQSLNEQCLVNMNDMISRYGKQVMICEVGMDVTAAPTCESFLTDIISKTRSIANGNGLGVFYWEPECFSSWNGYGEGAFDDTGKPTVAMNAFAN